MLIVETERLELRTWKMEDADAAFRVWGDPEVMRYIDGGAPLATLGDVRRSLDAAEDVQQEHGHCLWAVVNKSSGDLIGSCGFHHLDDALELAFHFVKSCWGQGFATEAARACLDYGFAALGATKVIAWCHPDNGRSERVLQKLNMIRIGLDDGEVRYEIGRPSS